MLKLEFPDGTEYELIEAQGTLFTVRSKKPYKHFPTKGISKVGEDLTEYMYDCIVFGGKRYQAKLITNKQ